MMDREPSITAGAELGMVPFGLCNLPAICLKLIENGQAGMI